MKGVLRFGKKGKLRSLFVGPFEILEQVGSVAYHLALPSSLSTVHNVFHVSILRKYLMDPSHMVDFEPLQLNENLSYKKKPVQVVAREVKVLCSKEVSLVKVLWQNHQSLRKLLGSKKDKMRTLASRALSGLKLSRNEVY
ncbi:uncharacterized protein LOC120076077 [Benincasa hispida]|uniref:uncharacterized protein LOC120076077 n=1 Tax=Benincasa hispida TaxID=102211 RepID=UPI00190165C4|nr:uncharacterized protein LOC120076077 [Benincasa hispida]